MIEIKKDDTSTVQSDTEEAKSPERHGDTTPAPASPRNGEGYTTTVLEIILDP
jgi:hypothetical protein